MKCLICGEKTDKRILCERHIGVDACLQTMTVHTCQSFAQKSGEQTGVCGNYLLCNPIKSSLKHEPFVTRGLGHIICPYATMNIRKIVNSEFTDDEIRGNYRECLE